MANTNKQKIRQMVQLSILTALVLLLAFTPIGYLRIGALTITFLPVPVVIGAVLMGPRAGAFLGCVFGLTSFAQCFGIDPFCGYLPAVSGACLPLALWQYGAVPAAGGSGTASVNGYSLRPSGRPTAGSCCGFAPGGKDR